MKPSASPASVSPTASNQKASIEFTPIVFFILGILLAASFLQGSVI